MLLFALVGIVITVYLVIKVSSLSDEIRDIREEMAKHYQAKITTIAPTLSDKIDNPSSVPLPPPLQSSSSVEPHFIESFFAWLAHNWMVKVGVGLILLAFGWFVSYAFIHQWIGPDGRIAFGLIAGAILAGVGTWRMAKNTIQGNLFLVLGSGFIIITSFAAQVAYNFFSPAVAIAIPFIVAVYITSIAVLYDRRNLAIYGVILGLIAPFLTNSSQNNLDLLFAYLAVVSIGSIWVAVVKNWRSINAVSLSGIILYSSLIIGSSFSHYFIVSILFFLAVVYFAISMGGIIRSGTDVHISDVIVAILNGVMILGLTLAKIPEEWISLTLALWMKVFGYGSFLVFSQTKKDNFFYMYGILTLVFLVVATCNELQGALLTIALAFEATAVTLISYVVTEKVSVSYRFSWLMLVPALMAISSFNSINWQWGIWNEDFVVLFVIGLLFFVLVICYRVFSHAANEPKDSVIPYDIIHTIAGSIYIFGLIWVALHAALPIPVLATILSLVIYTLVGLASYFRGLFTGVASLKYYGSTVLGLVVARLLFVDVWVMPLASRIIVFVVIGLLFLSTAFFVKQQGR